LINAANGYETTANVAAKLTPVIKNSIENIVNTVSNIKFQKPVTPMSNSKFSACPELCDLI
jgi:hypothetical protein